MVAVHTAASSISGDVAPLSSHGPREVVAVHTAASSISGDAAPLQKHARVEVRPLNNSSIEVIAFAITVDATRGGQVH